MEETVARTIDRTNDEFNSFILNEFLNSFPELLTADLADIMEFLDVGEAGTKDFISKWRALHSGPRADISDAEKRGHEWKLRQSGIDLLHDSLSARRRKTLQDKLADRRRGKTMDMKSVRISSHCHGMLIDAVSDAGGKTTIGKLIERLIERHLTEIRPGADLSQSQTPAGLVPVESVGDKSIVCLECGWQGVYLTRHIRQKHSISVDNYKVKWRLPLEWRMVPKKFHRP